MGVSPFMETPMFSSPQSPIFQLSESLRASPSPISLDSSARIGPHPPSPVEGSSYHRDGTKMGMTYDIQNERVDNLEPKSNGSAIFPTTKSFQNPKSNTTWNLGFVWTTQFGGPQIEGASTI